jgi:uncharacterized protein YbaP (TraB family)
LFSIASRILSAILITAISVCFSIATTPAVAAEQPVTMWRTQGDHNQIFILGSIHLLRPSDYPIPSTIYDAYDEAETLIMELDMDDMDPMQVQALVMELGMLTNGETLEDKLGSRNYAKAVVLADAIDIPLEMLAGTKPWLAAVTVETMMLTRVGFDPANGVEMHLMNKAVIDNKTVSGLETARQQIEMLNNLSAESQNDMLMQTLAEGDQVEELLDDIIDAWRNGDETYMEETLLKDMAGSRELYQSIVVERNRDWVRQIGALLDDDDDYLIVVGTMHLIGKDGVPQLLRNRGLQVEQATQ